MSWAYARIPVRLIDGHVWLRGDEPELGFTLNDVTENSSVGPRESAVGVKAT